MPASLGYADLADVSKDYMKERETTLRDLLNAMDGHMEGIWKG